MKKTIPLEKDNSIVDSIIYRLEPDFVLALMSKFKTLTENELKLCVLVKNEFSNEEVSRFMEIREIEIQHLLKRIQKKLLLKKNISIKNYLQNIIKGI